MIAELGFEKKCESINCRVKHRDFLKPMYNLFQSTGNMQDLIQCMLIELLFEYWFSYGIK